jgi:hypothetical protein
VPADQIFITAIIDAIHARGGRIDEAPEGAGPNPFPLAFELEGRHHRALVYVRRTTPQQGAGTDHGRPAGEWHTQMIFDDSRRGAGERNTLEAREGYTTVLFGYAERPDGIVIAAWDPTTKREFAYSRSLQVRDDALAEAEQGGIAQRRTRRGDEIVVAFRPEFLPEYLECFTRYHHDIAVPEAPPAPAPLGGPSPVAPADAAEGSTRRRRSAAPPPSPDFFGPRDRRSAGDRAVRDVRFKAFITDHYDGCAICEIQISAVLEAAHIIPVSDERGSDHPSNGLRLCRNCHSLYDAGLLLIRRDYGIEVSPRFAALSPGDAAAYTERQQLVLPGLDAEYLPNPDALEQIYQARREG